MEQVTGDGERRGAPGWELGVWGEIGVGVKLD